MIEQPIVYAAQTMLFASTSLTAIVGNNIDYKRGAVEKTWPLVHFFPVSAMVGYRADFNFCTMQFSIWSTEKVETLAIKEIVNNIFERYRGKVTVANYGIVDITWTELIDSGALPEADPTLFGEYLRFKFRYRGANLGGL
jgi:hypothetical protein